jgi:hypothetical protein
MTRIWTIEHQDYWPVTGRSLAEAEAEAVATWFDGSYTDLADALAWGICTIRPSRPAPQVHPLIDPILDIVRPPKDQP